MLLGAFAAQVGTAFLRCPEAKISELGQMGCSTWIREPDAWRAGDERLERPLSTLRKWSAPLAYLARTPEERKNPRWFGGPYVESRLRCPKLKARFRATQIAVEQPPWTAVSFAALAKLAQGERP